MSQPDDMRAEPKTGELDCTPEADRQGIPREIFFVFAGVNVAVTNLAVGALGIVLGLALTDVLLVYFLGAIVGSACVGLCVLQGQRTGASVMVNARPAFGFQGARILAVLLFFTTAGWFGVNSYFGVTAARSIAGQFGVPGGHVTDVLLLAVLTLLLVLVAVYGYRLITKYERVAVIGMGISLVIVAVGALAGGVDWGHPASVHGGERLGAIAVLVTALGVGWGVSWTPFAHDFGRYVRRDASQRKVFLLATAGMYLGTFCTFSLSAIIATGATSSLDVGKTVEAALPGALAWPVLLVMTLGLLPANLVNLFVGPAVLQTVGLRLSRLQGVLATALVGIPIAVMGIFQPEFGSTFKAWMLTLVLWLTPWLVITMTDYFIIHRGRYSDIDLFTRNGVAQAYFMPGIVAWVVGLATSIAFTNTPIFASPLMTKYVGGADLSLFVGALVAFVIYYPWASWRKSGVETR
ncbi:cytosine permease [Mycobacterium sp. 21AC1]|uniref:purine-cytosine permease family protein n=1 Tax=[Mycobacterium] appelbergii TaxID=2939269 RepID=UPI0029394F1E|nr:cytosine permease [Mycobacterium sp. 21AC1]MDV3123607.1 cytosine permease [Mycobacterium sp. 21AC1]